MASPLPPGAQFSPSVARNREPILAVLREALPASGTVLEIASGSGEHAAWFAAALPGLLWQPTDRDDGALRSIEAHRSLVGLPNLLAPLRLDASSPPWPIARADSILCVNMIHISAWAGAEGLMAEAGRILPPGGVLVLYGPFLEAGTPTAPSNVAFDAWLRAQNPAWGVRDLEQVTALAARHGLARTARVEMPANNLSIVLKRLR